MDAMHALMGRSRAVLVGYSLDDLAGETTPVNIPGLTGKDYPCWTRRMRVSLEDLAGRLRHQSWDLGGKRARTVGSGS